MDRIEFTDSIDNITTDDMIHEFESIMALYNIVGEYNIKISKTSTDVAAFDVTFNSKYRSSDIVSMCDNMKVDIYDQPLIIKCIPTDDNSVQIIFNKV